MRVVVQKHSGRRVEGTRRSYSSNDHVDFVFVPLPKCTSEPWTAQVETWLSALSCIRLKLPAAKKKPTQNDDKHLARYGGRLKGGSPVEPIISEKDEEIARQEYARFVIRFATFVDGLQEGMQFTIFYLLKETFSLQPAQVSLCFGLLTLPWLLKPVYAYISDFFPIHGEKRRPYIIAMSLLKACCYIGVGLSSTVQQAMFFLALSSACRAFVCATLQGFLIEEKRVVGADTSDLVSEYFWIRGFGTLCTAYFSGMLLSVATSPQILLSLAALPLTVAGLSVFVQEKTEETQGTHWDHFASIKQMAQSASFVGPMLFLLSYSSGPDYDDAMSFYYINQLHFPSEWMGRLRVVHAFACLLGISSYRWFFANAKPKDVFLKATIASIPFYLVPALITTGAYHVIGISPLYLAIGGNLLRESILYIQMMPAIVLVSNMSPKGFAATTFASITTMGNIGRMLQRITTAVAVQSLGVTATNFVNMTPLIAVCGCFLASPLAILPFIPDDIDEEGKEPPDAGGGILTSPRAVVALNDMNVPRAG